MSRHSGVADLDAVGQAQLVHTGQVSAVELTQWAIERIEALNPTLNAVVATAYEPALAAAARVPRDAPLAGVPYLVKDLIVEAAGMPFTEGSNYLRGLVSQVDSELVMRLRRAGVVILGKTNCPEFGMVPTCEPLAHGPTRNPWDLDRSTSGSSGGSAAAVAAGMVPAAHGNDLGGSLRYPASACGVFGLKPTRARNPLGPEYGDAANGWACEHALTRTVRDSAALLDATCGPALGDPYPAPPPARHRPRQAAHRVHRPDPRGHPGTPGLSGRAAGRGCPVRRAGPRAGRGRPDGLDLRGRSSDRHGLRRSDRLDRRVLDTPSGTPPSRRRPRAGDP